MVPQDTRFLSHSTLPQATPE